MFNLFDFLDLCAALRTARIEDAFQRGLSRVRLKAGKMDDTPMELLGAQKVDFLNFHPYITGEMIQFDEHFQMGSNHQLGNLYHFDDSYVNL